MILVAQQFSTVSGVFNLNIQGNTDTFVVINGKIKVQGQPLQLSVSTNSEFPTSQGWSSFVKPDGQMGFTRVSTSSKELEVVMLSGGDIVTADIVQVVSESGSAIPVRGMHVEE